MILKSAIDRYLNAPRDDHRWMKDLSRKEIDGLIADLRPRPKLSPILSFHQRVAFYLGVAYPQFSYWIDMGGGKTLLTLELYKYWRMVGAVNRMLVFCISDKAFPTWEAQVKEYNIDVHVTSLEGSGNQKWRALASAPKKGIVLAAYQGCTAMCSVTRPNKKGKNEWVLHPKAIEDLSAGVEMLVMDESTMVGNHTSLYHELCDKIARRTEYRYALAGWPFGRDPTLLWAQQAIVEQELESFGTLGLFRTALFSKEKNKFARGRRAKWAVNWIYNKRKAKYLNRMMQHRSITFEEHEWGDVPKVRPIREPVRMGADQQSYYHQASEELVTAKGDFTATKNAFLRMRQITSGFIGFKGDETGEKIKLKFAQNPKLERVMDLIMGVRDNGRKICVFYEFTWSAEQIHEALRKARAQHIWLWGGTKDTRKELQRFYEDDYTFCALIQNRVGSFSMDGLQKVANYQCFYESPVPVIQRKQAEKRIARQGQPRKVIRYDLVVPRSVDTTILDYHQEGTDLMTAVRKNPKVLLRG